MESSVVGLPQAGDRIGDWEVVGELGRGGMAIVLSVVHVENGSSRAMKLMLPAGRPEDVARRFRREFRALSRLDHPHVLKVFEGGILDGRPWFVMEHLDGRELKEEVEEWRGLPPMERVRRANDLLIQVGRALEYVHGRGLVHRDITPSNIMVLPDGTAKLMDFGVVKEPGGELTHAGEVVGTVAYIAPEQIHGGHVDARADLYSLGAVFYLMLTGRRPFNARTLAGYMDKHLNRPVRPPRELVPTIPESANDVCVQLLAKDPADRFASATHLLHVLHAAPDQGAGPGTQDWTPPLVGRTAELSRLRERVARLAGADDEPPSGGVVVLDGRAGMGMGRMAREVAQIARQLGLPVSRGRNQDPGQDAFEGFRVLFDDLCAELNLAEGRVPETLAATFGRVPTPKDRIERYVVLAEVGRLVAAAGRRVVILEQMHHADRGTIELTEYLARNHVGAASRPLLVILTRTPPEPGEPDPLADLLSGAATGVAPLHEVLGPISPAAVEELVLDVVEDSPQARRLAERLHGSGNGNPFVISEMIRDLVTQGVIDVPDGPMRGQLTPSLADLDALVLPVPSTLRDVLAERLAPLSYEARRVALALAVSRHHLDLDLLGPVTGMPEPDVIAAVDELISSRLVRERRVGDRERFELDRTRVADVLLQQTSPEVVERFHQRIGRVLEELYKRRTDVVVESLSWHFEQGDEPGKAFPYLLQAAEKVRKRSFVAEALSFLDRATALEPRARGLLTLDEADRRLANLELARSVVLMHLGQPEASEAEARRAHALAVDLSDDRLQVRTATELGCHARRTSRFEVAEDWLRQALARAEQLGDKRAQIVPLYEFGAVQWSRGDLEAARDYFVQAMAGSEAYQDEQALVLGANGLGIIALCRGQSAEARRYFSQSIEVASKHGLMDRLSVARTNLVEVYHLTGNLRKGLELADQAVAHAREVRHEYGIGMGLRYRVLILTDLGRLVEAEDNATEAIRIQQELGNPEDVLAAQVVLIRALLARGAQQPALSLLVQALALVPEFDSEGFEPLLHAWRSRILAAQGHLDEARESAVLARKAPGRMWPHQRARLVLNLARIHRGLGEDEAALKHAEEALRIADSSGYRLYAMRARQLCAQTATDETAAARHARVGDALARSLAANLDREDAAAFLRMQGVQPRLRRWTGSA